MVVLSCAGPRFSHQTQRMEDCSLESRYSRKDYGDQESNVSPL